MEQEPKPAGAKEQPPLTDDQARELLQEGKKKEFLAWMTQEQMRAQARASESDKSPLFEFDLRLGNIYRMAGETQTALRMIKEANANIQRELIELNRTGSEASQRSDKDAYSQKLRGILQNAIYLEQELKR